jgi:Cu2+-exporting ATPase
MVAGRSALALKAGVAPGAVALDAAALASTALTGHPLTSAASVVLSTLAEHWRDGLLADTDELLEHLVPEEDAAYQVTRGGRRARLSAREIGPGDRIELAAGQTIPVDGIFAVSRTGDSGRRVYSGERANTSGTLRAERNMARSRAERLRAHIRHALLTRDQPGPLTPDIDRMMALPIAGAGLVLALTKDTARTASMLQADPQQAVALSHPVVREAALFAVARHGALMSGLDAIQRLAAAESVAFQDVAILTEPYWHVGPIEVAVTGLAAGTVRQWLSAIVDHDDPVRLEAGIPDAVVDSWIDHGVVLAMREGAIHVAGSRVLEQTWGLQPLRGERHSLARWIGVVRAGKLLARVQLDCRLRPAVARDFSRLRQLGVKRIAVFTENPYEASLKQLQALGADDVVAGDRVLQARWLEEEAEAGRRLALVHTSMRDLLPPGGLSLCPVDAEAGAHGVLLGAPLASLIAARAVAGELTRAIRQQFGTSMAVSVGLMLVSALSAASPIAVALARHGASALLLLQGAGLARRTAPHLTHSHTESTHGTA